MDTSLTLCDNLESTKVDVATEVIDCKAQVLTFDAAPGAVGDALRVQGKGKGTLAQAGVGGKPTCTLRNPTGDPQSTLICTPLAASASGINGDCSLEELSMDEGADAQVRPVTAVPFVQCNGQVLELFSVGRQGSRNLTAKEEAAKRHAKRAADISLRARAVGVVSPRALQALIEAELRPEILAELELESDSEFDSDSDSCA